ncbi:receptor kinase, partial [Genlisea aurea]
DAAASSQALLKFKSSLANVGSALSDWSAAAPPCSGYRSNWNGVLCFEGYVWGLQLENMSLQGQIDVGSLVPLRFLRTISLKNNEFQGPMPDWRKLGALKSLFLSKNRFSGHIPADAFKGMTWLKKVDLADNDFSGQIPASLQSPKLIELRLENNQFTGTIPAISSENLKLLNVSNNQLQGPIPRNLQRMDPNCFSGNKALCGKPLATSCSPPIPPPEVEPSIDSPPPQSPPTPPNRKKSSTPWIVLFAVIASVFVLLLLLIFLRSRRSPSPRLGREGSAPNNEKSLPIGIAAVPAAPHHSAAGSNQAAASAAAGSAAAAVAGTKLTFVRDDRQKFDLPDLMRASAEVLGSGNFGASYKAVLVDGESLVVKRFKQMNSVAREDFHEHMRRLGGLKHQNLLPLVAYLYRKEEKLLVFDYIYNGSLATHLHGTYKPGLTWGNRLKIIKGVAEGLSYLHNELPTLSLPHGHLKSSNVLLDTRLNPLLMDCCLAPVVNPNQVHQVLVAYQSPDYFHTGKVCRKTDVWCLGILILETLTGKFVANYLPQHGGGGEYNPDLAGWIHAVV